MDIGNIQLKVTAAGGAGGGSTSGYLFGTASSPGGVASLGQVYAKSASLTGIVNVSGTISSGRGGDGGARAPGDLISAGMGTSASAVNAVDADTGTGGSISLSGITSISARAAGRCGEIAEIGI